MTPDLYNQAPFRICFPARSNNDVSINAVFSLESAWIMLATKATVALSLSACPSYVSLRISHFVNSNLS